jgi:hypothetical protein
MVFLTVYEHKQRSESPPKCIKYQTVPRQSTNSETIPCSPPSYTAVKWSSRGLLDDREEFDDWFDGDRGALPFSEYTVKKGSRVSRPQPGCHYQTPPGREL